MFQGGKVLDPIRFEPPDAAPLGKAEKSGSGKIVFWRDFSSLSGGPGG
jgi:hypothetical protein